MGGKKKAAPKKKKAADDGVSSKDMEFQGLDLTRSLALEKVDSLNSRIEMLKKENDSLKARLAKSEKDTHEFVAYFQREMEQKDAVVAALKDEAARKEAEFRMASDLLAHEAEKKVSELTETASRREGQLQRSLRNAEDEVVELADYRDHKAQMEDRVRQLQEELQKAETRHLERATAAERKHLEEKARAQRELEQRLEEMRQVARLEAQSGLDADTRRVVLDNRRMAEELRFQLQMMGELQAEKRKVEERAAELRRLVELAADKEAEYAKQRHAAQKELRQLREKVLDLQGAADGAGAEVSAAKAEARRKAAKEVDEHRLDAQGLRQLLLLKNKELRHIKKLAQTVLDQRTEVETYFLEALAEVKEQIRQQRAARHRKELAVYKAAVREARRTGAAAKFPKIRPGRGGNGGGGGGGGLPPGGGGGGGHARLAGLLGEEDLPSALPAEPSGKVALGDLTWQDRERVLRLLFAKINNVQGMVEALPAHPLSEVAAAQGGGGGGGEALVPGRPDSRPPSYGHPRFSQSQPVNKSQRGGAEEPSPGLNISRHNTEPTDWFGGESSGPTMPGMA